jgi:dienelactone hydrolase
MVEINTRLVPSAHVRHLFPLHNDRMTTQTLLAAETRYAPTRMNEQDTPKKRNRAIRRVVAVVLLVLLAFFVRSADRHVRAASLLLRFADPDARGFLPTYRKHIVNEKLTEVQTARGIVRARMYSPEGVTNAPGLVLVHGVHRLAIDEPRLVKFARALASVGMVVLTPEVKEIADYRIDALSIETIGAAAHTLRGSLHGERVGLMGMSFAGGLGLLAASNPAYVEDIAFVLAIGAHHDIHRVLGFFKTNHIQWPDGHDEPLAAHPYGALVLLYSHVDHLVPKDDAPEAREAIKFWLWEQQEESKKHLAQLSPQSRITVESLLDGKADVPKLIDEVTRDGKGGDAISPKGHLSGLKAPVFLLHGATDNVIPAAETAWIASEVPPQFLAQSLVTPAVKHVELEGQPSVKQQWELVHFMAGVLDAAEQ